MWLSIVCWVTFKRVSDRESSSKGVILLGCAPYESAHTDWDCSYSGQVDSFLKWTSYNSNISFPPLNQLKYNHIITNHHRRQSIHMLSDLFFPYNLTFPPIPKHALFTTPFVSKNKKTFSQAVAVLYTASHDKQKLVWPLWSFPPGATTIRIVTLERKRQICFHLLHKLNYLLFWRTIIVQIFSFVY